MKPIARKPKVQITWANGTTHVGEVNHTTLDGEYNVTLDGEITSVQVPAEMVRYLLDVPGFAARRRATS